MAVSINTFLSGYFDDNKNIRFALISLHHLFLLPLGRRPFSLIHFVKLFGCVVQTITVFITFRHFLASYIQTQHNNSAARRGLSVQKQLNPIRELIQCSELRFTSRDHMKFLCRMPPLLFSMLCKLENPVSKLSSRCCQADKLPSLFS